MEEVTVDGELSEFVAAHGGGCRLRFVCDDIDGSRAAIDAARRAVGRVPHPEEPAESFVSFVSGLEPVDDGWTFWFDAADIEAYPGLPERVVEVIVAALRAHDGGRVHVAAIEPNPDPVGELHAQVRDMTARALAALPPDTPIPPHVVEVSGHGSVADATVTWYLDSYEPSIYENYKSALAANGWKVEAEGVRRKGEFMEIVIQGCRLSRAERVAMLEVSSMTERQHYGTAVQFSFRQQPTGHVGGQRS